MTAIRFADSLRYGAKTLTFLVGILVVGGGAIALGVLVARNEVAGPWFDPVITASPELVAGLLLGVLGGIVLVSGLISLWFKVLTDAIAYGFGEKVNQIDLDPTVTVELEEEIAAALVDETTQPSRQEPKPNRVGPRERIETATDTDSVATQKTAPATESEPTDVNKDVVEDSKPTGVQETTLAEESSVGPEQDTGSGSVSGTATGSPHESAEEPVTDTVVNDGPVQSEEWEGEWKDTKKEESQVKRASTPREDSARPSGERPEKTAEEIAFGSVSRTSPTEPVSDETEEQPRGAESSTGMDEDSTDPLAEKSAVPEEEVADESEPDNDSPDVESGTESEERDPLDEMLGDDKS